MLTRKSGPSVARMIKRLGLSKAQAQELKDLMNDGFVYRTLARANEMLDGFGREYLRAVEGGNVEYINRGDSYKETLLFDFEKDKFIASSWGDLVERQPRRFS